MPFKIVQTLEDGSAKLSIVPAHWESKGVLWWPPKNYKYPFKLIKDENSRPGAGWFTLQCVLKRKNIRSYEEANRELIEIEQNTDTDFQELNNCNIRSLQSTSKIGGLDVPSTSKTGGIDLDCINFEVIADNLSNPQPAYETSMANIGSEPETIHIYGTEAMKTVIANQDLFLMKLNTIIENQKNIAHKVASLSVQLEEMNQQILNHHEHPISVTLLKDSVEESESFSVKPIETNEEFERLETFLADKTLKKKISKFLSILCSSSPGKGITCAYKLMDALFTREFLCECSWSGGSKGERSKIPLKNFSNFRKFFFDMIRTWDPTFTDDNVVNFFKLVLRNATKRKSMQGLRASTKRSRKAKTNSENGINPGKQVGNQENEQDINNIINSVEPGTGDGDDQESPEADHGRKEDNNTGVADDQLDLC